MRVSYLLLGCTVGYLTLTRSFAYLGIVPANIFLGELVLAGFVTLTPRNILGRMAAALVRRGSVISPFSWALYAAMGYGVFQVLRSTLDGYAILSSLRILAFVYYMLFVFVGMWWGRRDPSATRRLIVVLAWWNAIYGLAHVVFLSRLGLGLPWAPNVPLFTQTVGSAIAIIGLISVQPRIRYWRALVLVNGFVLVATQVRALWLGFAAAFLLGIFLIHRVKELMIGVAALALVLSVLAVTDATLPGPLSEGGTISADSIIGRAIAPFDPVLASRFTDDYAHYQGTVNWRIAWWRAIWDTIHQDPTSMLIGFGYGHPLSETSPFRVDEETRSPHNWFFFSLGYGGWIGVLFFLWCQAALVSLLWKAYRRTGSPLGILVWANSIFVGMSGNFLEAPFGAIPLYLIIGLCLAPLALSSGERAPQNV